MTTRTHLLLCIGLLIVLAILGAAMRAQIPDRIDLPFDSVSTIMAAEFAQDPADVAAVIGLDHRWVAPLRTIQYIDFAFIVCYVALFVILALRLKEYEVPGARWLCWISVIAAVAAGAFDIAENITVLRTLSMPVPMNHIRMFSLPKWGLVFVVMVVESTVFFFWPRLGLWWRLAAVATGSLWLVAGSSGALFTALESISDIPWSASWMQRAMTATLIFLIALLVRNQLRKA